MPALSQWAVTDPEELFWSIRSVIPEFQCLADTAKLDWILVILCGKHREPPPKGRGVCKPWHRDLCWSKESNLTGLSTPYLTQRCADVEISELGMELIEQSLKKSVYLDSICKSLQSFPSNQKALLFALFCVESNNINFYHHFANLQHVRQFLPLNTSAPVHLF